MATTRAKQLEKIKMQLPTVNQQFAEGQKQARMTQLQSQVQQAPMAQAPGGIQSAAAQQTLSMGQPTLQAAQKTATQQQLIGQEQLAEQGRQQRATGFSQNIALTQGQRAISDKLAKLDIRLKNELLDNQLIFKKGEANQDLLNTTQMMDWAAANARSEEELADYIQIEEQVTKRELQILQQSHSVLEQSLRQKQTKEGKQLTQDTRKRIIQAKADLEKSIRRKQAEAKNKHLKYQGWGTAFGMVGGAVLGSFLAPGGGTAAGAAKGAAIGAYLGKAGGTIAVGQE